MPRLPQLATFTMTGPCWSALVDVVELGQPHRHWGLRTLQVAADVGCRVAGVEQVYPPGTLLVVCRPRTVWVSLDAGAAEHLRWESPRPSAPARILSPDQLQSGLRSGELALVLAHADPAAWPSTAGGDLPTLTCLGGELSLARLSPQEDAHQRLFDGLGLTRPADADSAPLLVTSSGLDLWGIAHLPWDGSKLEGRFQIVRVQPDPMPGLIRLHVRPDLKRSSDKARADLAAAWSRLAQALNPDYPLNPGNAYPQGGGPRWVTLEIVNPAAAPALYWQVDRRGGESATRLQIERGELNLLLTDQPPYDQIQPPTSLARVIPDEMQITLGNGKLELTITAGVQTEEPVGFIYTYERSDQQRQNIHREAVQLKNLTLSYDAVQTARLLREDQGLTAPARNEAETPVLWGWMPLADGWAQLPFLNLAEEPALVPDPGEENSAVVAEVPSPLQGAVSFGNRYREVLQLERAEHPWGVTLIALTALQGTWTLDQKAGVTELTAVDLNVSNPELVINGLLWLSTGRPTAADALPNLDNWVSGVRSIALRTVTQAQNRATPMLVKLEQLAFSRRSQLLDPTGSLHSGRLGAYEYTLVASQAFFAAAESGPWQPDMIFARHEALVWRRHPTLPMIQALPLTQRLTPPSHPSPSRQLAPYALALDGKFPSTQPEQDWRFFAKSATCWPRLRGATSPARAWRDLGDLPMVALSLAGLTLGPAARGSELTYQYRYDLPYTDEIHALARLPRAASTRVGTDLPRPLLRVEYEDHWQQLAEQAALAAADAVAALPHGVSTPLYHLVEPYAWPAQLQPDLTEYPGRLRFDSSGYALELGGSEALVGLTGMFAVEPDGRTIQRVEGHTTPSFSLVAGSMAGARTAADVMSDQRGLVRGASSLEGDLIVTPVSLHEGGDLAHRYRLCSTLRPWELAIGEEERWQFWFRDLPLDPTGFQRAVTRSSAAEDTNDPDATARRYNYLSGYEWRLDDGQHELYLKICGLWFYPLTLDKIALAGGLVDAVELTGRLQLPIADIGDELVDLANAVRVRFERHDGILRLAAVTAISPVIEWPLATTGGSSGDVPRLVWKTASYRHEARQPQLDLGAAELQIRLFNVPWRLPITADTLSFSAGAEPVTIPIAITPSGDPIQLTAAEITLDPRTWRHQVWLDIKLRLGQQMSAGVEADRRSSLAATVRYHLLGEQAGVVTLEAATLFDDLELTSGGAPQANSGQGAGLYVAGQTLQITWERYLNTGPFQLLPGMILESEGAPGYGLVSFEVEMADKGPRLRLLVASLEAVLHCRWGEWLHEGSPTLAFERLFSSSAGDLTFGYTSQWQPRNGTWSEQYLLNGLLEIKSVISWPADVDISTNDGLLTLKLPALGEQGQLRELSHLRHTIRILLNQHSMPAATLEMARGATLFQLAPGASWQFLAVVEHQLATIKPGEEVGQLAGAHHWTCIQEVRLLRPQGMLAFLNSFGAPEAHTLDPYGISPTDRSSEGYFNPQLKELLHEALRSLPSNTILVEASVAVSVGQAALTIGSPTLLQYLPGGNQLGVLSSPDDFDPPDQPGWFLLTLPFLGRLQDRAHDQLAGGDANPLMVDPIRIIRHTNPPELIPPLALALGHWGSITPVLKAVAALDAIEGHRWARLDPTSCEESWYRLQTSSLEPVERSLESITAARPEGPARLSRPAALRRAFVSVREAYPPRSLPDRLLPPEVTSEAPIWREGHWLAPQSIQTLRAVTGLTALYFFTEGAGKIVFDHSATDAPVDLTVNQIRHVAWVSGGGIRFMGTASVGVPQAPRIIDAWQQSQALTVECWLHLPTAAPSGPVAILAFGRSRSQAGLRVMALPPSSTAPAGFEIQLRVAPGQKEGLLTARFPTTGGQPVHLVFTRAATGAAVLYVNGVPAAEAVMAGRLDQWPHTQLTLSSGSASGGLWLGTFRLVALYDRALKAGEVEGNYSAQAGHDLYGWATTRILLHQAGLASSPQGGTAKPEWHAAMTHLPIAIPAEKAATRSVSPVTLVVSPYRRINHQPAPSRSQRLPRIVVVELLAMDSVEGTLLPAASNTWEVTGRNEGLLLAQRWAREEHQRMTASSPAAMLRLRWIEAPSEARHTPVAVSYTFEPVTALPQPPNLVRTTARLRSPVVDLRFREGQYGGKGIPDLVQPQELAPPLVTQVRPLAQAELGGEGKAQLWGLSGLLVEVRYSENGRGSVGRKVPDGENSQPAAEQISALWWQAPQHQVQYRPASSNEGAPAAGLPPLFRAPAVRALLTSPADLPLPDMQAITDGLKTSGTPSRWQPILPGTLRYLILGARPGVMLVLRHQLIRQMVDSPRSLATLTSGSIPVQHRTPRPLPLPANNALAGEAALRPWASTFEPWNTLIASASPVDEAFFAAGSGSQARRLRLRMVSPIHGAVAISWDGSVEFDVSNGPDGTSFDGWDIQLTLTDGSRTVVYQSQSTRRPSGAYRWTTASAEDARLLLADKRLGDQLTVRASVRATSPDSGIAQQLSFTLRVVDETAPALPLSPIFALFEDPEYNRRLTSSAARSIGTVQRTQDAQAAVQTIILAADRQEYNPDSRVSLLFDTDSPTWKPTAAVRLRHIDQHGITCQVDEPELTIQAGSLMTFSLRELGRGSSRVSLQAGDVIECVVTIAEAVSGLAVRLTIVEEPVEPAPEAAYALLRWQRMAGEAQVECVRFAWGPAPSRTELVCADDLRSGLVRRRAVFQWTDTVRIGMLVGYAVQKIAANGATYVPAPEPPVGVLPVEVAPLWLQLGVTATLDVDTLLRPDPE